MTTAPARGRARPAERGLTLLEVLAATMIFALVMTVLVGTSTTAVHRSGLSARRLEAGLVADAIVADLEIGMRKRIAPVVERSEWKTEDEAGEEEYSIRVLNRPIQEALAAPATTVADEVASAAGAAASDTAATKIGGAAGSIGTLLAGDLPEVAKHLHQYDVEVAWVGVDGPESVTRTTFAFDWQAAQTEFADLFAAAGGGEDAEGADEDGNGDAKSNGAKGRGANGQTPSLGNPSSLAPGQQGRFVP